MYFACILPIAYICLTVDIESFWMEGYAGQNSGHELAIYVLWL